MQAFKNYVTTHGSLTRADAHLILHKPIDHSSPTSTQSVPSCCPYESVCTIIYCAIHFQFYRPIIVFVPCCVYVCVSVLLLVCTCIIATNFSLNININRGMRELMISQHTTCITIKKKKLILAVMIFSS